MSAQPQPFIWYDLMTPDIVTASAFYSIVVGWSIADSGMPGMAYSIIKAGDAEVGGMMGMPPGFDMPSMWTGYIRSGDVNADCRRAAEMGGTVCKEPEDIPGVGRFAVLADPGGATFNIFQPNSTELRSDAPRRTPGHVSWRDLSAADGAAAWDFYSGLFRWQKEDAMAMGPGEAYQMFSTGGETVGGMMTKRPDAPAAQWTYFFAVDAIAAAVSRVRKAGGSIVMEPMEVPGGEWITVATDPFGATFGLSAVTR